MKVINIPYYLIIGFNVFTLILYISDPFISSGTANHLLTIGYVAINIFFLAHGIKNGLRNAHHRTKDSFKSCNFLGKDWLKWYFIFYVLTFTLKYAYELRCDAFNINALINRIAIGIQDPRIGYTMTLNGSQAFNWSLYMIINMLDSIFFIVCMINWRLLNKFMRIVFCILLVIELFKWFGAGTSFGIVQMATTFIFVISIGIKKSKIPKRKVFTYVITLLGVFLLVLIAFSINMKGRGGGEFSSDTMQNFGFNKDSFINNFLLSNLSTSAQNATVYIEYYLSGAYYNLERVFDCSYDWTFLCGSTNSMTHIADIIGLPDVSIINYQSKMIKFGIDPYIQWHTCYLWLANDFTLLGVPIVIYYLGKYLGLTLYIYRRTRDSLSGILFVILANTSLYLFANNNYFSGVIFPFIILFIYWHKTRLKKSISRFRLFAVKQTT